MVNITKLLEIVTNNNYDELKNTINSLSNSSILLSSRNNCTLLYKAIERRSIECFDILINSNIKFRDYNESLIRYNYSAFNLALEYFINAPNLQNKYMVDRLLNKMEFVSCRTFIKSLSYEQIALRLIDKIEVETVNINRIIKHIISNNIEALYIVYDIIKDNDDNTMKEEIYHFTLKCAIDYNNMDIIEFMKGKMNINFIDAYNSNYSYLLTGTKIPTLYYIILYSMINNDVLQKYFITEYKNLLADDKIEIQNMLVSYDNKSFLYNNLIYYNSHHKNILDKYYNLVKIINPTYIIDDADIVLDLFDFILENKDNGEYVLINIEYLLKNKVITNPLNMITDEKMEFYNNIMLKTNIERKQKKRYFMIMFQEILLNNNFAIPNKVTHIFDFYLD
jgi:hypothetical protein